MLEFGCILVSHFPYEQVADRFDALPGIAGQHKFLLIDGPEGTVGPGIVYGCSQTTMATYRPICPQTVPGSNHFLPLELACKLGFAFTWIIEYDVLYGGDWTDFFACYAENRADFLSAGLISQHDDPDRHWFWWHSHHPLRKVDEYHTFNPLFRISLRAAERLLTRYREGWQGHHEVTIPTILLAEGLRVEDLGRESYGPETYSHQLPIRRLDGKLHHPVKLLS